MATPFVQDPFILSCSDDSARAGANPDSALVLDRRGIRWLHRDHGHVDALEMTLVGGECGGWEDVSIAL